MKCQLIIIATLFTLHAGAQDLQEIRQLLQKKDFKQFSAFINEHKKSNVEYQWKSHRDIVGDYQEGVVRIFESLPLTDSSDGSNFNNYTIEFLTGADSIFYYKFSKTVFTGKIGDEWQTALVTVDSMRNAAVYTSFENLFRQEYKDTLNHTDLFLTSVTYGSVCGNGGGTLPLMRQLNLFLVNKEVDSIRQWLTSPNAEKQLFALRGYRVLVHEDYFLTKDEERIIAVIAHKKGKVNTCGGCLYNTRNFQQVVEEINSIPDEYLKVHPQGYSDNIAEIRAKKSRSLYSYLGIFLIAGISIVIVFYLFVRKMNATKKQQQ